MDITLILKIIGNIAIIKVNIIKQAQAAVLNLYSVQRNKANVASKVYDWFIIFYNFDEFINSNNIKDYIINKRFEKCQ